MIPNVGEMVPNGGAGGGQVAAVADLTALSNVNHVAFSTAILTDPQCGGPFVWSGLNLSVQVANDPGHGVYVPTASDASGASGAWVRSYQLPFDLAWWGLLSDGVTDNSLALANFGVFGRYYVSLNGGIETVTRPGRVLFDNSLCYKWNTNLGKWIMHGVGTTWVNAEASVFGFAVAFTQWWDGLRDQTGTVQNMLLTANTVVGAQTFQVATADAARLTANETCMLGSFDVQGNGFPINLQQQEKVTPISFSAPSGGNVTVTIKEFIKYQHRMDYPDVYASREPGFQCGAARAWLLTTDGWHVGDGKGGFYTVGKLHWNVKYRFIGPMEWERPAQGQNLAFLGLSGEEIITHNVKSVGFAESVTGNVVHYSNEPTTGGETDKLNDCITHHNIKSNFFLSLQSANDRVHFIGGDILGGLGCGPTKLFIAENVNINAAAIGRVGEAYGVSGSALYRKCRIFGNNSSGISQPSVLDGTTAYVVGTNPDGTVISYANGVFRVTIASTGAFTGWANMFPGAYVAFQAVGGIFPGDQGVFRILQTYADATYIYIVTDGPAAVPAWCINNKFWYFQFNEIRFEGCTGSDMVRAWSEACELGHRYFEYRRYVFAGETGAIGGSFFDPAGTITEIDFNVIKPGGTAGTNMTFTWPTYAINSNYASDAGGLAVTINIGGSVRRVVLTKDAFTGTTGSDAITLGGSPITALPLDRVVNSLTYSAALTGNAQSTPTVEVIVKYDCGMVRKLLPVQFELSGGALIGLTGLLP